MPSVNGVAGIDDAVFLHLGDRIGQKIVGHLRVLFLDQRIGRRVVAVEVIVPADDRGIDEALHQVGLFVDQVAARLDQRRIGGKALVGEQEDLRLELRFLLDGEGLRRDIALHRAVACRRGRAAD